LTTAPRIKPTSTFLRSAPLIARKQRLAKLLGKASGAPSGTASICLSSIFNAAQIEMVDKWIYNNAPAIDRPEAIRRFVEIGLKGRTTTIKAR
jgi:hypothetical protein